MTNKELATRLARDIFKCGDDGPERPATRMQYKSAKVDGSELDGGGFIEPALANFILQLLDQYGSRE